MPSVPQSLLWISLVVLWLFVLVPMLVSKREAVRRTSDVALATRVLTSSAGARLLKRSGPAAGHASDPDWRRDYCGRHDEEELPFKPDTSVARTEAAAADESTEPDYLDVDVVEEDSGALPVGESDALSDADDEVTVAQPVLDEEESPDEQTEELPETDIAGEAEDTDEVAEADEADESDDDGGVYEYVEDSSGLEAEDEPADSAPGPVRPTSAARRRRSEAQKAAAVEARKYRFRKRALSTMALVLAGSAAVGYTVTPDAWRLCAGTGALMLLYLAYLRRQTRIEAQVQARRARREARARASRVDAPPVQQAPPPDFEVVPSRLRRPGAMVLDLDDEDPAFEHLASASFARDYDWRRDLPRAAGQ